MVEVRAISFSSHGADDGTMVLDIDGVQHAFGMRISQIATRLTSDIPDRLLDLLDIAATVFAADASVSRGGLAREGFGDDWRRHFDFTIPVREPDFWSMEEVSTTLAAAVDFLTDDRVRFRFTRTAPAPRIPAFLAYGSAEAFCADHVMLFSGGLDSLAGAAETLNSTSKKVVLVTHRSAQVTMPHQDRLVDALKKRFPGRITWVPFTARRMGSSAAETTQRSRSLLFAATAFLVSEVLGASTINFFENGVISQNLPISPQVVGTMATRTTHPFALVKLGELLGHVAGRPTRIGNPYAWLTKAEVIERLVENGGAHLVKDSVSCSKVRSQTILHPHCGACSQCIDRRTAVLACDAGQHDPAEAYETDVFAGERTTDLSRTMAVDWTRHAHALAGMPDMMFAERFGAELARICDGFPERPSWQVTRDVVALQRRHGQNARAGMQAALCAHAAAVVAKTLPSTSLLRMFISDSGAMELATMSSDTDASQLRELPLDEDLRSIFPLKVTLEETGKRLRLTVRGLGSIEGAPVTAVKGLKPYHAEDVTAGLGPHEHRYVPAGGLAAAMSTSKQDTVQRVRRCRRDLAEQYEAVEGVPPPTPLLIENRKQKGYRLDPNARFLEPEPVPGS
jgi:7-cyano-7-deazaguanine synthase in queuosine biosynthesis